MKIAFFDTHRFEREFFESESAKFHHSIRFLDFRLSQQTASLLKPDEHCVCVFVNDCLNSETLSILKQAGVRLVALRSAGFNHVDLEAARHLGLTVVRVPEYSPFAVAEHAVALILTLNRKTHRAFTRVREGNFSLDGLVGFDLHGKTVGVIGTGRIGSTFCKIMSGFGCRVLAFDSNPNLALSKELGVHYVELDQLLRQSDVISLHVPLNPATHHMIDARAFSIMKPCAMLINTGRGALIDTHALVAALKSGRLGSAGLDVYEEEEAVFFRDLSDRVLKDDTLVRLLTFPNVVLTSHQAFLTQEALQNIAETTLQNISDFENAKPLTNEVRADLNAR